MKSCDWGNALFDFGDSFRETMKLGDDSKESSCQIKRHRNDRGDEFTSSL
jgi:hypothetical protein